MELLIPFIQVLLACVVLKYACDLFEQQAGFFGRNMPAGIRGATVDAVGSSMPEFMSAIVLLFFYDDPAMFAVALGIAAGSAVYNCAIIPSLAILFAKDENGNSVKEISIEKRGLMRDVFWVVISDLALISMVVSGYITVWMAVILNLIYVGYAIHLYIDSKRSGEEKEEYEFEPLDDKGLVGNILTFNFNKVLFKDKELTMRNALVLFAIALVIILFGTHILVEGVLGSATVMGVHPFISGLVLGAAASSLPDTILSMKAARNGEYEDAVANPLASNTFDTSISIGLPLLAWLLWNGQEGLQMVEDNMTVLRMSVVAMSFCIGLTLIKRHARITKWTALSILSLYAVWISWVYVTFC